jgi:alpha-tubulin suppressor-like RCC1 family protein
LKSDGTVWAWGANSSGQLGDGTVTTRLTPVQVKNPSGTAFLTGIVAIAAGGPSIALKSDGTLWSWGLNASGQLGDGTTTNRLLPVQVVGQSGSGVFTNAASIAASSNFTLAAKSDGTLWTWGFNGNGQLGNGTLVNSTTPVQALITGVAQARHSESECYDRHCSERTCTDCGRRVVHRSSHVFMGAFQLSFGRRDIATSWNGYQEHVF